MLDLIAQQYSQYEEEGVEGKSRCLCSLCTSRLLTTTILFFEELEDDIWASCIGPYLKEKLGGKTASFSYSCVQQLPTL